LVSDRAFDCVEKLTVDVSVFVSVPALFGAVTDSVLVTDAPGLLKTTSK
jgi:hypothetical protein